MKNDTAENIVRNDVLCCVTSLVCRMLDHEPDLLDDFDNLYRDFCSECGEPWDEDDEACACGCEDRDSEPNGAYEYWAITDWLASELSARGEMVCSDFYGLTVWGRGCSGQAIAIDDVICELAADLDNLHGEG